MKQDTGLIKTNIIYIKYCIFDPKRGTLIPLDSSSVPHSQIKYDPYLHLAGVELLLAQVLA